MKDSLIILTVIMLSVVAPLCGPAEWREEFKRPHSEFSLPSTISLSGFSSLNKFIFFI
jgi:hypothetical protein